MIDSGPDGRQTESPGRKSRWIQRGVFGAACMLVIGVYSYTAHSGFFELWSPNAGDSYYNLLVQGFRAGQLSVNREVPPELARLTDPYDPSADAIERYHLQNLGWIERHRLHDLSYYKGKLYLYFGVTPAVLLFWPYVVLTGHYLLHKDAVVVFFSVGFLAGAGLLWALWRRYFAGVGLGTVVAGTLALGLANLTPVILTRSDVWEVAISCGYALTMLALVGIWCALHQPQRRRRWLAAASVAYGLAVGARPFLLLGAVILLVPVIQAWREKQRVWPLMMAAVGPIVLIGLGLMLYNGLRFDNPLEFGQRYQLPVSQQGTRHQFSLHYLWFNFRVGFLEPARWRGRFPFVQDIRVPPAPRGIFVEWVQLPFGVLSNIPLVWLALAVPLAWRGRSPEARSTLRWFLAAVALLFGICALVLGVHDSMLLRYEVEFLPALLLLAVVGILGLERALAPTSESGRAERPVWRRAARWGWGLLLGFSVAFNLLASVEHYAEADCETGDALSNRGEIQDAVGHYERALRIRPDFAEAHNRLGAALVRLGRVPEAIGHFEQALRINPNYAEAHYNLGVALEQSGKIEDAIRHYEQALRVRPDYGKAQNGLARLRSVH